MRAAARPSTKRAVAPGTSSSGRTVGPVAEVMPSPLVSSVGMLVASSVGSLVAAAIPPVLLAAVPIALVLEGGW